MLVSAFTPVMAQDLLGNNFAAWINDLALTVEATDATGARLRLPFSERLCRQGGNICGQALIAASDTAMVLAISAASGAFRPLTTVDLTMNYMRPIIAVDALLDARVKRLGKTIAFCTCEITDAKGGKIAAFATGTFALIA
jgi:uncharacterized protein (TIGR00369 family)